MNSLRGQFLIASPQLPDPNFARTVILMVEHHDDGALGLVLNRKTDMSLDSFWHHVDPLPCPCQQQMCLGGPVEGYLLCLHANPEYSEGEVVHGVHLATRPEHIRGAVDCNGSQCRVFWGYAGWGAGQLEAELGIGGWLTTPACSQLVFQTDVDSLWQHVISRSGENILREALKIHEFPPKPGLN